MRYYYTVYGKDDDIIACGTSGECAEQLGLTVPSFYTLVCRINKGKKYLKYSAILIDTDKEENEDTDW